MFYKTVAITVLLSLIHGLQSASIENEDDDRIINGESIPIEKVPFLVSIQSYGVHFCGGIIYNSRIIVTAAHCVETLSKPNITHLSIVAGTDTLNSGGIRIPFESFAKHQYYNNSAYLTYDIALIKLKSALTFTKSIQPIALATKTPASGAAVYAAGFGILKNGQTASSTKLQGVELQFIPRAACGSPPNRYTKNSITETMICAGEKQKSTCKGDSGGPLITLDPRTLLGIVSWGGLKCAADGEPGVYTNVAALRNWISNSAATMLKN